MKKRNLSFSQFAELSMQHLKEEGRFSTLHLYDNAIRSFKNYLQEEVKFAHFTRERLKSYYNHLIDEGKKPNTISTYLRMLRSIYNQAVDQDIAPYIRQQFRDVYTGVEISHKRATSAKDIRTLLYSETDNPTMQRTQHIAALLFWLCGIPYVDLAHVKPSYIKDNILQYHRSKTHTKVAVSILPQALEIIEKLKCEKANINKENKYLFHLLSSEKSLHTLEGYEDYQSSLHQFNRQLKILAKSFGIETSITSYTFRHSWATTAIRIGTPIEKVSEMLGHKSIKTTQIYFKGFDIAELKDANKKTCEYMMREDY